ncbi:hypothetical protein HDU97_005203 [Phlyctochytrium planicorne]|nr:hypothetical protein HDU97_005203 [Phlyctochytrium planicorne]
MAAPASVEDSQVFSIDGMNRVKEEAIFTLRPSSSTTPMNPSSPSRHHLNLHHINLSSSSSSSPVTFQNGASLHQPSTPPRRLYSNASTGVANLRKDGEASGSLSSSLHRPHTHSVEPVIPMRIGEAESEMIKFSALSSSASSSFSTPIPLPDEEYNEFKSSQEFRLPNYQHAFTTPQNSFRDPEDGSFTPTSPCPDMIFESDVLRRTYLSSARSELFADVDEPLLSEPKHEVRTRTLSGLGIAADVLESETNGFGSSTNSLAIDRGQVAHEELIEESMAEGNDVPMNVDRVETCDVPPLEKVLSSQSTDDQYETSTFDDMQVDCTTGPAKDGCILKRNFVSQGISVKQAPSGKLFERRRAISASSLITAISHLTTSRNLSKNVCLTVQHLPSEVLASVLLYLPNPTILCLVNRFFHALFMRDAVMVARWLIEHNHTVPRFSTMAPVMASFPNRPCAVPSAMVTSTPPRSTSSGPTANSSESSSQKKSLSTTTTISVIEDLRPVLPTHPLLACLKHQSRHRILRILPETARCLLLMAARTSRYDLQRIHRRAVASDRGLLPVAEIVSERAIELFGGPVANTVSVSPASRITVSNTQGNIHPQNPPTLPIPMVAAVPPAEITGAFDTAVPMQETEIPIPAVAPAAEWIAPSPVPIQALPAPPMIVPTHGPKLFHFAPPTVDDRRALLDAAVGGDSATVGVLIEACGLGLDARVISEAFARAWDRGDSGNLCNPEGWLWPRCQASRWLVLERLAREDEDTFGSGNLNAMNIDAPFNALAALLTSTAVTTASAATAIIPIHESLTNAMEETQVSIMTTLAAGVASIFSSPSTQEGSEPASSSINGVVGIMSRIMAEAMQEERRMLQQYDRQEQRSEDGLIWAARRVKCSDNGCTRMEACLLHGGKGRWGTLSAIALSSTGAWMSQRSFLDRILDAVVTTGSSRGLALILSHRPKLHPRHLTAALDRGHIQIYCLLVAFGADPTWPEDVALARYIRRPPTDSAAAICWKHAFGQGVALTARRWEAAVRLGPSATSTCLESWMDHVYMFKDPFSAHMFNPIHHFEVGFRLGGPEVIRALSDAVDATYACGDVLAAAAMGDSKALQHCLEVGAVLAEALRDGDRDRVGDLLDAGALVLDDALAYSAAIADSPPGDWEEWPTAARCYRRILVQQRLRLPIPSREAFMNIPSDVVTEALLCSLHATRPICESKSIEVYARYQRRRHPNAAGIRINLVPVLEGDVSFRVVASAMESLKRLLAVCDDPAYPGEAYCFIKGMLQFGLRDKNLLRDEDEFFLPDDEWDEVAAALMSP